MGYEEALFLRSPNGSVALTVNDAGQVLANGVAVTGIPPSSIVLYAVGSAGLASGATTKILWGRNGGTAPIQVGSDVTLDGSDAGKVNINTPGLYALNFIVGLNTIGGNTAGSPITGAQALMRLTGSENNALDQILVPYAAGGELGAVPQCHLTQRFAAGDSFTFYVYAESLLEALSITTANANSVVTCAAIQPKHLGMPITGTGIPASSFVGTVTPGVSFILSSTKPPTANTPVNANASGTAVGTLGRATINLESIFTCVSVTRIPG